MLFSWRVVSWQLTINSPRSGCYFITWPDILHQGLSIPSSSIKKNKFKAVYVLTYGYISWMVHIHIYLPGTCQCPAILEAVLRINKSNQSKEMSPKGSSDLSIPLPSMYGMFTLHLVDIYPHGIFTYIRFYNLLALFIVGGWAPSWFRWWSDHHHL